MSFFWHQDPDVTIWIDGFFKKSHTERKIFSKELTNFTNCTSFYDIIHISQEVNRMVFPKQEFNKASVKDANINKGLLVDFFNKIDEEKFNIHSMVLLKDGSRVFRASAYSYDEDTRDEVWSTSKSFLSVAIGILIDQGLVHLDDPILFFFSKQVKNYLPEYENVKVRHLLTMSVGQERDVFDELDEKQIDFERFFNIPLIHEPGKVFMYNNGASFILSAIVTMVTGQSLNDFLDTHVYQKIGIAKPQWLEACGISYGAMGLQASANDMARFGLLLLNDGQWDGEQIISKDYLDMATSKQIKTQDNEFEFDYDHYGYGFQFWVNSFGDYRAAGWKQQYIIVNKEYGLVFAIKSDEARDVLTLYQNYILEAAKTGWNYCDYSLRDYTRRFKANSEKIIKNAPKIL